MGWYKAYMLITRKLKLVYTAQKHHDLLVKTKCRKSVRYLQNVFSQFRSPSTSLNCISLKKPQDLVKTMPFFPISLFNSNCFPNQQSELMILTIIILICLLTSFISLYEAFSDPLCLLYLSPDIEGQNGMWKKPTKDSDYSPHLLLYLKQWN